MLKRLCGIGPFAIALLFAACGDDEPEGDPLEIVTKSLPDVALGASYDSKIEVRGGITPYAFSISNGALPTGLSLASATGQIAGSAGSPGHQAFTISVKDAEAQTAKSDLVLYVIPESLVVETSILPEGLEQTQYAEELVASGGVPPYVFSVTGDLPTGITLSEAGLLEGIPTVSGSFQLQITATDHEDATATRDLTLVVRPLNPMISTSTVPEARFGHAYLAELTAEGGVEPYTWSVVSGDLPLGLSVTEDGAIVGTPLDSGDFPISIRVTDTGNRTDEAFFSLHVVPPLVLATTRIPQILAGRPFEFQMTATGGKTPYTWSLVSGAMPAGLTLESDGRIHGTSTVGGRTNVTISVTDAYGDQKPALFTIEVNDRYIYSTSPALAFPENCTATSSASYVFVQVEVPDSMQIADIDVGVDLDFTDPSAPQGNRNGNLKTVIVAPNGVRAALCGAAAGLRQEPGCRGSGGINTVYGDLTNPFTPLRVFNGMNPQGIWTFIAVITRGEFGASGCRQSGVINAITLSIREDIDPTPYVRVTGYSTNELIVDPWVRLHFFSSVPDRELFLTATQWGVGANGRREGGGGDDVPDTSRVFTWRYEGSSDLAVETASDGYVQGLAPSRSCINTGNRCGTGEGVLVAEDGQGTEVRKRILVVPPDWNPLVRSF